ncbi:LysR family transcriptional regulator [Aliiglaciecola sp. LCG003]|uniref:LysR family transcriptional regulator n=1 Tax=Aliiglaciecola sp. LCG003 TaxID=3053655 RepID=UPI00257427F9|nr:LysR family transcriptional regulator [Aliiglaciecola sp. LCG003]WJG11005.1 LysR family transcriptional regulator [Aliiglaciecola sp. LCG003]
MLSYKQLQAFITLAQSTTFAEAAEKIHLSQPALSSAIKKLEQFLGGNLFSRTTRKVQLTHEGREFLPVALRLSHDWESAIADMQDLFAMQRGKLTIAAMPSFASSVLPAMLKTFHQRWSDINISVRDVVMEEVIRLVREGRAELGFTFEAEQLEGLDFHSLMSNEFVAVMSSSHPLSAHKQVVWQQISQFPIVAMNRGSSIRKWIEQFTELNQIKLNIVAEANQLATLGEFVKHELGISVVPGICEAQFSSNDLVCLPISDGNLKKNIGIIRASRKSLSVPAQALWDSLIER